LNLQLELIGDLLINIPSKCATVAGTVCTYLFSALDKCSRYVHNKNMHNTSGKCKAVPHRPRHRITVALDGDLWEKFRHVLPERWGGSFTSWLEYAMECYSRDSCTGCPYEPEDDDREKAPDGIGKVIDKEN